MYVLVTYDVNVVSPDGRNRLRKVSQSCLNYGIRVQNSVFECDIEPAQFITMKNKLLSIYDPEKDSLRFYHLGSNWRKKVEHYGAKPSIDLLQDPLIF